MSFEIRAGEQVGELIDYMNETIRSDRDTTPGNLAKVAQLLNLLTFPAEHAGLARGWPTVLNFHTGTSSVETFCLENLYYGHIDTVPGSASPHTSIGLRFQRDLLTYRNLQRMPHYGHLAYVGVRELVTAMHEHDAYLSPTNDDALAAWADKNARVIAPRQMPEALRENTMAFAH
ncbi:MAG: hypothetical protein WAQ25_04915 [Candidatus Saccharimonas sp.]